MSYNNPGDMKNQGFVTEENNRLFVMLITFTFHYKTPLTC